MELSATTKQPAKINTIKNPSTVWKNAHDKEKQVKRGDKNKKTWTGTKTMKLLQVYFYPSCISQSPIFIKCQYFTDMYIMITDCRFCFAKTIFLWIWFVKKAFLDAMIIRCVLYSAFGINFTHISFFAFSVFLKFLWIYKYSVSQNHQEHESYSALRHVNWWLYTIFEVLKMLHSFQKIKRSIEVCKIYICN